jgi:hypothetical protein
MLKEEAAAPPFKARKRSRTLGEAPGPSMRTSHSSITFIITAKVAGTPLLAAPVINFTVYCSSFFRTIPTHSIEPNNMC